MDACPPCTLVAPSGHLETPTDIEEILMICPRDHFSFRAQQEAQGNERLHTWTIPESLPYFDGHFPGDPILPAAAIIDCSVELLRTLLAAESTPFIKRIHSAKFTEVLRPGDELVIELIEHSSTRYSLEWSKRGTRVASISLSVAAA